MGEKVMVFINRENERNSFKSSYEKNKDENISQVYIIEANHGVGKTEFIREVSKYFSNCPLEIFKSDDNEELSVFKRMVLELDKTSIEYEYDDFKTFYRKKTDSAKAVKLLLKITANFAQAWAKRKDFDVDFSSLIEPTNESEKFILNAQIENIFEYSKYVFNTVHMHIIFHQALIIDSGSLDLLSKLIASSEGSVFIFECDNEESSTRIEQYIRNSHSIFYEKFLLNKLSNAHLQTYIQQLLYDLKLEATIKFHNNEIDEDIQTLLNNAKITAYDEYDRFAINNNLLVYYILKGNISSLECQKIVIELENMLNHTNFKRFIDKINYNLYHYYLKMFNYEKSEYYKIKLLHANIKYDNNYKYKLIYETSWKLPINIK